PLPPRVTAGFAPDRGRFDGWRSIAWLVRAVGDLARYSDPRFDRAPVLRRRMRRLVLDRLERPDQFDPLARRVARCVARRLAAARRITRSESSASVVTASRRATHRATRRASGANWSGLSSRSSTSLRIRLRRTGARSNRGSL